MKDKQGAFSSYAGETMEVETDPRLSGRRVATRPAVSVLVKVSLDQVLSRERFPPHLQWSSGK